MATVGGRLDDHFLRMGIHSGNATRSRQRGKGVRVLRFEYQQAYLCTLRVGCCRRLSGFISADIWPLQSAVKLRARQAKGDPDWETLIEGDRALYSQH